MEVYKMSRKDIHVVPHPKGWAGKTEGNERATFVAPTKKEAMEKAREIAIARQVERVEHGKDGRIMDSDSYGADPCPPPDAKH
jgi:hypothetical protein